MIDVASDSNFAPNSVIAEKWEVMNVIGKGAFGVIVAVKNLRTNEYEAMKLELDDPSTKGGLMQEIRSLQSLADCPHVCRLLSWGKHLQWKYVVLALCGENLVELAAVLGAFPAATVCYIGLRALVCLEAVHAKGFIHRDVKPSNFVVGLTKETRANLYLIDFGIAKRIVSETGELQKGEGSGFRGTDQYASINSHMGRALGKHDDLWSLFYMLCDLLGLLPWRTLQDRNKIGEAKRRFNAQDEIEGLAKELLAMRNHLRELTIEHIPQYSYIKELLQTALNNCDQPASGPKFQFRLSEHQIQQPLSDNVVPKDRLSVIPDDVRVSVTGSRPAVIRSNKSSGTYADSNGNIVLESSQLGAAIPQAKWIGSFSGVSESMVGNNKDELNVNSNPTSSSIIDFGTDTEDTLEGLDLESMHSHCEKAVKEKISPHKNGGLDGGVNSNEQLTSETITSVSLTEAAPITAHVKQHEGLHGDAAVTQTEPAVDNQQNSCCFSCVLL